MWCRSRTWRRTNVIQVSTVGRILIKTLFFATIDCVVVVWKDENLFHLLVMLEELIWHVLVYLISAVRITLPGCRRRIFLFCFQLLKIQIKFNFFTFHVKFVEVQIPLYWEPFEFPRVDWVSEWSMLFNYEVFKRIELNFKTLNLKPYWTIKFKTLNLKTIQDIKGFVDILICIRNC